MRECLCVCVCMCVCVCVCVCVIFIVCFYPWIINANPKKLDAGDLS